MKTYSTQPLERIAYFGYPDRPADVYLRDNISQESVDDGNGGTFTQYCADEVHLTTTLSKDEVEQSFDALWVKAETESKPLEQRVAELEEMLDATLAVVLGE